MLSFITDLEGDWTKFEAFVTQSKALYFDLSAGVDQLRLREGHRFLYGGDAVDNGPGAQRFVRALTALKRYYRGRKEDDRVVLLAGNRDLNKIRLLEQLRPDPTPERLRTLLSTTMNAGRAFDFRKSELEASLGRPISDGEVVANFLEEIGPGGGLREYLRLTQLAYFEGGVLAVHGAVTDENLCLVPRRKGLTATTAEWVAGLNAFAAAELTAFDQCGKAPDLIAYQGPNPATPRLNRESVIYGRNTYGSDNPVLPRRQTLRKLQKDGVQWVLSGHTPSGDSPSILRAEGVGFVLADNSLARHPSVVEVGGGELQVKSFATASDTGERRSIGFTLKAEEKSTPLGRRTTDKALKQWLIKGLSANGDLLLSHVGENFAVAQLFRPPEEIDPLTLQDPVRE